MTALPYDDEPQLLMLHEVPSARQMTEAQRFGACCLWCDTPAVGVEGGLEPLTDGRFDAYWRPGTCRPCRDLRLDHLRSHVECRLHTDSCEDCVSGICPAAVPLILAHALARQKAGKSPEVTCAHCHRSAPLVDLAMIPTLWDGNSTVHRGYVHSTPCPSAVPLRVRVAAHLLGRRPGDVS
ncbi:hypothetical protein ACFWNK_02885 [Streptomyces sp. NPDC058417]|uniref:hypothetical protein n=1 Tax=unclassified Streptomyces TaxID=2593676 RepID=UPI003653A877